MRLRGLSAGGACLRTGLCNRRLATNVSGAVQTHAPTMFAFVVRNSSRAYGDLDSRKQSSTSHLIE